MIRFLINFWSRHIHPRIASLIATVGIFGLSISLLTLYVLAQLAEEVLEREAFAFDKTILLSIHSVANSHLDRVMLVVTSLGNPPVVVPIFGISLIILWWQGNNQEATMLAIASSGAFILNRGLKVFFNKPRPQLWTKLIDETSYSFPSGHALGSMVLYGFIAYLLATHYPKFAFAIYSLATILIGAIGMSRLYLGVHWPTDVITGYGVGFLWLISCVTMLKLRQRKHN
ncbi:phosphatase PAP2 family protein [Myxosarcina sp. GI1]|uniref:phosphatase PAP2 family protein n=1 Tax=Myxosarcina sp. GI1 TaxID=1541065 RepID=UPI00056409B7|nr:phosphatase PAP2 family protein [Myxosarcina sp. GI1]